MTVGSLFSGIGGLDLGFERAGFQVRWQVEKDEYCNKVLQKHWPSVPRYSDVKDLKGDELEKVDVIIGGFPCQPVSCAGKRKGQEDERWLWPEFYRIIRAVRPRFVVVENVPGLLNLGFGDVLRDLAQSGYDAEWDCIPAAAVGAPHLRYRIFIVAYTSSGFRGTEQTCEREEMGRTKQFMADGENRNVANTNSSRRQQISRGSHENEGTNEGGIKIQADISSGNGERNRTGIVADSSRIRGGSGDDGRFRSVEATRQTRVFRQDLLRGKEADEWRSWWATESSVCRVVDGCPNRVHRLRCLGNAVVPQVAEYIARLVLLKAQSEAC